MENKQQVTSSEATFPLHTLVQPCSPRVGCNLPSPGNPASVLALDPMSLVTTPAGLPASSLRADLTGVFLSSQIIKSSQAYKFSGVLGIFQ